MKKKYYEPYLVIEEMKTPLLTDVSEVPIGGTGELDAKPFSSDYYDDDFDDAQ